MRNLVHCSCHSFGRQYLKQGVPTLISNGPLWFGWLRISNWFLMGDSHRSRWFNCSSSSPRSFMLASSSPCFVGKSLEICKETKEKDSHDLNKKEKWNIFKSYLL